MVWSVSFLSSLLPLLHIQPLLHAHQLVPAQCYARTGAEEKVKEEGPIRTFSLQELHLSQLAGLTSCDYNVSICLRQIERTDCNGVCV